MKQKLKMKGVVKFFNQVKGFGFIKGDEDKEYFVHSTGLNSGVELDEGVKVTFDTEKDEKGFKAVNVSIDSEESEE